MAISLINVGQIANDGTGDDLREAFIKINQNFEELDLRDDEQTTASNLGSVGEGIFANRVNYDLQFKKIVAGSNVTLSSTDQTVVVNAVGGLQQLIVSSDSGSIILRDGDAVNLVGGEGIETSVLGNTITITNTSSEIVTDTTPQLGGNLDGQNFDINNVNTLRALTVEAFLSGNVEGNVWDIDVRDLRSDIDSLEEEILGFDFGSLGDNATSILEWLAQSTEVDFGTFLSPTTITSDFGSF
jgi:hypothetical protein